MVDQESLIVAYILDGQGAGKKIGWNEIKAWTPEQGTLWIHLDFKAKRTQQWLKKESGLSPITAQAMIVDDMRPRCEIDSKGILMLLRGVNLNPGQDPEDMVSIRIWFDQHRIITTRKRPLLSVNDLRDSIEKGEGPSSTTQLFLQLNDRLASRINDVVNDLDDRVDELEEAIVVEESYQLRPKIADIRREAILIRRYLAPQRDALVRLQADDNHLFSDTERLVLRETSDRYFRFVEDLDSIRERGGVSQEELASRLSEQLDQRMYILAVIAAIFLPLTFITGLLGINVGGIPGANHKYGFITVCIILVFIFFGLLWLFKRKKWV